MKKSLIALLILGAIIALGATDYWLSRPKVPELAPISSAVINLPETQTKNLLQTLLDKDPQKYGYALETRSRTTQIFEKVDLNEIKNTIVLRNILVADGKAPLTVYEVQGPKGQGSVTYLNVKLKFLGIKDATTDINEVGTYGHNSFFFNDKNQPDTGFLIVLLGDDLLGFQYSKNEPGTFDTIKKIVTINASL